MEKIDGKLHPSRLKYYAFPLVGGIAHFFTYLILILVIRQYAFSVDIIFLSVGYGWEVIFITKDTVDQIRIRRGKDPAGPPYMEHGPFVFMLFLTGGFSIFLHDNWFLFP